MTPGVPTMLRKLLLPAAAMFLVAGCVTTDYGYRGGQGDYYYGSPATEYRHQGGYYPYGPYPYGYYGRYPYGSYGYPYYGYPYGGYYRYPYYYRPGYPSHPRPPQHREPRQDRPAPWRDYDEMIRRRQGQPSTRVGDAPAPATVAPRSRPPVQRDSGSRMQKMIRQAQQRDGEGRRRDEP
ncbi:hypothetical protein [Aerolutibacter ruishenii]|nr:hypothetical protein [Lysobacter ruishenii]